VVVVIDVVAVVVGGGLLLFLLVWFFSGMLTFASKCLVLIVDGFPNLFIYIYIYIQEFHRNQNAEERMKECQ
jgi:hypothetical protein